MIDGERFLEVTAGGCTYRFDTEAFAALTEATLNGTSYVGVDSFGARVAFCEGSLMSVRESTPEIRALEVALWMGRDE